jgi:predicted transcriptional regulator
MESRELTYLNDEQEKYVRLLRAAVTRDSDSRVLVYLLYNPGATSKEIFLGTGICFGTLSLALGRLREEGLVTYTRDPGKHGFHRYSVTPRFGELIDRIESGIREEKARCSEEIKEVKKGLKG